MFLTVKYSTVHQIFCMVLYDFSGSAGNHQKIRLTTETHKHRLRSHNQAHDIRIYRKLSAYNIDNITVHRYNIL